MAGRSILIKFLGDSKGLNDAADGVTGRLGKIKGAIGEADGFFGKLKAGGGAALESVGGAGAVAAAGVAAAGAAAFKGLNDFKDLGIEIGKFVDATGTAPEAASRLIEVAGDVGISADTLEGSIGKMNKAASATPQMFADLGVEIVKTKDGLVDTNATFLGAVERLNGIKDPAAKAEAASKLFGRGWQSMAELIGMGAPKLKSALASVSDQKIFDQKKIDDAKGVREAFDMVADAAQDLFLTIGSALAPVVAELAPLIKDNVENLKPFIEGFGKLLGSVLKVVGPIAELTNKIAGPLLDAIGKGAEKLGQLVEAVSSLGDEALDTSGLSAQVLAMHDAETAADDMTTAIADGAVAGAGHLADLEEAADDAKAATEDLTGAYLAFKGALDEKSAWLGVEAELDKYKQKMNDASASNREKQQAIIDLKGKLVDYLSQLKDVPTEKATAVLALIDQGRFVEAENALAWLGRTRNVVYNPQTGGQAPTSTPDAGNGGYNGPVRASTASRGAGGGGATIINNVYGAEPAYVRQITTAQEQALRGMQ